MPVNRARVIIARFGTQTRFAELLGLRQSTVNYWAIRGSIPQKYFQKIMDVAAKRGVNITPTEFLPITIRD